MKRLVIIGAGGFGREMLAWARQATSLFHVIGFLDDNLTALAKFPKDVPVLGRVEDYKPKASDVFVCAMGQIETKRRCVERILENVTFGRGVILCPYAAVSSDVKLGDFVSVNLHSTVAHDSIVGKWSQLHCHVDVTGGVVLGEGVLVGSHASILPGIKVGDNAIVGAGSIVTRDVAPGVTVFGAPARPVARREPIHE
jgi:sugar O-acyltransferase (sialic acid O-acetyltransferase NeuD family)